MFLIPTNINSLLLLRISNEKWKDQSMICKYMFSVMKIYLCIVFKNHSTKVSKLYYQNQKYCFANFSILLSIIHLMKSARHFFWHSLWFKLWTCIVVYLYDLYVHVCNYYQSIIWRNKWKHKMLSIMA